MSPITNALRGRTVRRAALLALLALPVLAPVTRGIARAQTTAASSNGTVMDDPAGLHLTMTPRRPATPGDSVRAAAVAAELRRSILRYADTTAAVSDGYRMFAPQIKNQKVYHFTRGLNAIQEAFRFDPSKPTSLLYEKGAGGGLVLVGGMFTAPKRFSIDKLDERVPLSVARWHKHVNWCVPARGQAARWLERANGHPVFGPESPVATRQACDAVGGVFYESPLGWMVHANVMTSSDPATVWGDDHAGHDMHDGMKHDIHQEQAHRGD